MKANTKRRKELLLLHVSLQAANRRKYERGLQKAGVGPFRNTTL
jgi:hypothetical protein